VRGGRFCLLLLAGLLPAGCTTTPPGGAAQAREAARINVELGVKYFRAGRLQLAQQKLLKAVQQDPASAAARDALGVLYERLGEPSKADRAFRTALRLNPKGSRTHNNYGAFLCRQRRWDEAEREFDAALRDPLYPHPELVHTNAALCARQAGRLRAAERHFRQALAIDARFAPALLGMARLSLQQKHYLRARAFLSRYWEVARRTPESLWLGIRTERALGNRDAVASYRLLLQRRFPDSPQARRLQQRERDDGSRGD